MHVDANDIVFDEGAAVVVSASGYCVLSSDSAKHPDVSALASIVQLDIDDKHCIDQWLLDSALRIPKNRKFMGLQDKLAVVAAARSLLAGKLVAQTQASGFQHLSPLLNRRCGVYMAVGYIPFEYDEVAELSANSQIDDEFSMARFSSEGVTEVNPLLTFRCLPNMPAFHVSMNLCLQGPYSVSYPDIGQYYQILQQAIAALRRGEIDFALVGGVADQNNFLVQHQLGKLNIKGQSLDCAGFLLLERKEQALQREVRSGLELLALKSEYRSGDLLKQIPVYQEVMSLNDKRLQLHDTLYAGPASLAMLLSALARQNDFRGEIQHRVSSAGNIDAVSQWQTWVK